MSGQGAPRGRVRGQERSEELDARTCPPARQPRLLGVQDRVGEQPAQSAGVRGPTLADRHAPDRLSGVRLEELVEVVERRSARRAASAPRSWRRRRSTRAKTSVRQGDYVEPSKITLGAFLRSDLAGHPSSPSLKATSFIGYRLQVRRLHRPGDRQRARPSQRPDAGGHRQHCTPSLHADGRTRGRQTAAGERKGHLRPSVRHTHAALRTALAFAVTPPTGAARRGRPGRSSSRRASRDEHVDGRGGRGRS